MSLAFVLGARHTRSVHAGPGPGKQTCCVPVRLHERGVVKRSGRTGNRTCLLMHADAFSMMLRDREVIWSVDSEGNPVTDEWPGCRAGSLAFTTSASIQLLCRWIWRREIRFQKWCMQPPILIPWEHGALAFPPTTSLHLSRDISRYKKCAKTSSSPLVASSHKVSRANRHAKF